MNVEERLKELIIKRYGTMKDFTDYIGIPNSTFANIMRRGVRNANVLTIIKICQALGISTDALAEGMIVPIEREEPKQTKIEDILDETKRKLLNGHKLTLDGKPVTQYEILQIVNAVDAAIETAKRNNSYLLQYFKKLNDKE